MYLQIIAIYVQGYYLHRVAKLAGKQWWIITPAVCCMLTAFAFSVISVSWCSAMTDRTYEHELVQSHDLTNVGTLPAYTKHCELDLLCL
jgi:hypothetical protein